MPTCTIVIPCFNESDRLDLRAFIQHVTRNDHRFIFVNDGSTDETGDIIDDLADMDNRAFIGLHLSQNRGKAEAVRCGVNHAFAMGSPLVGYWDADLATPLDAIPEFEVYLQRHSDVEFLLGSRVRLLGRSIERKPIRHCLGRAFATVAAATLHLPVYDTQCGAKMFRATPPVKAVFRDPFRTRWLFDVELLARFLQIRSQAKDNSPASHIHEFPLTTWRDVAGSKVKPTDFLRALWQLGVIHQSYRSDRSATTSSVGDEPIQLAPTPAYDDLGGRRTLPESRGSSTASNASTPQTRQLNRVSAESVR